MHSHCGTISTAEYPEARFDIIYFSHVIEHLLAPRAELAKLAAWLKPGGILVCGFPVYGTLEWSPPRGETYYDVPRHQLHITRATARKIFSDAGLRVVREVYPPYGWGLYFSDFKRRCEEGDPLANAARGRASRLPRGYYLASFLLSLFRQSGNAFFYAVRGASSSQGTAS